MGLIQVHDKQFKPFLSQEEIATRIEELAAKLKIDYAGSVPLFIPILNGSFMFAADLFKALTIPLEICFIKLASYKGTISSGRVITSIGLDADLFGRDVIILEDIVDTGKTLSRFLPQLWHQQPASLKICTLLYKPDAVVESVPVDYFGFAVSDKFVIGYGLDYDGLGRNMKEVYQLVE